MTAPTERPWICRADTSYVPSLTLRWFRHPADTSTPDRIVMTASARGVRLLCYLHEVPAGLLERASVAHRMLELGDERAALRLVGVDNQLESQVESQP